MSEQSGESGPGESGSVEGDDRAVEAALKNGHRRRVVRHLCQKDGETSLMSLALRLQSVEGGTMPDVINSLHDHHLPKLEKHGVVERQGDSTVVLDADIDHVKSKLAEWQE